MGQMKVVISKMGRTLLNTNVVHPGDGFVFFISILYPQTTTKTQLTEATKKKDSRKVLRKTKKDARSLHPVSMATWWARNEFNLEDQHPLRTNCATSCWHVTRRIFLDDDTSFGSLPLMINYLYSMQYLGHNLYNFRKLDF